MSRHTIWSKQKIGKLVQPARKPVEVYADRIYREIGIRSHGKGIFYKDEVLGRELGGKRVFWVEPGCFVVNIVFAWEQAVAKTTDAEKGMIASHRFPMYRPLTNKIDLDYLLYFFKTPYGKYLLELASPGGAGRNKTLGQEAFLELAIPVPPIEEQRKIAEILSTWDEAIRLTQELIAAKQLRKKGLMQRLLAGQVRFKEFGERPWKEAHLSDLAQIIMGQSPSSDNYNQDGIGLPLIQGNADVTGRRSAPKVYTSEITKECEVGDILLSVRAPVGETAISVHHACIGRGVCAIRAKKIDQEFLYQLLLFVEARWQQFAQGSTFTAINSTDIKSFKLVVPECYEEQRLISAVLQACDEEIQLLQQKLAALQRQKKGLMQRLLTGQVRVPLAQTTTLAPIAPSLALTPTQAFIIWLIAQYQPRKHAHPSRTEAQKLAYFAQEAAGLPLNLHFYSHVYGPFSKELYQHLADMEGSLISGFQGGEPQERKEIEATPEAIIMAEDVLRQCPAEQTKLAFVLQLVQGFETPRQMELLATVHWIMKRNPGALFAEIVRQVYQWNEHKQSFHEGQIRQAWEHLRQFEVAT
ncbi:MAG: restriction endonuclease subunit S [Anaerolinea sp.]|nr:restriction endonuclease subunit S [Anaerolinea sp.]